MFTLEHRRQLADRNMQPVDPKGVCMAGEAQSGPQRVAAIVATGTSALYARNSVIFRQAEAADGVYYVEDGLVKLDVASSQGKRAVIALLGPETFFGEACLADQPLRNATATALLDTRLVYLRKAAMHSLLQSDSSFAQQFITHLVRRAARVEADLIDRLFNSTEKRLARALLLLASLDGESQSVLARINQQTLAEIVGTTRPRVSHFIGKFRKRGLVSKRGPLRVYSSLVEVMLED
jgi:CRP/FNR family cyclic AMP-dependent transcriptional regulator